LLGTQDVRWFDYGLFGDEREFDSDAGTVGPAYRRALSIDLASVLGDYAVADRKAESGALADFLGGEEGVEDFIEVVLGNAGAVVGEGDE